MRPSLPSGFAQVCPQPASPGVMQCSIVVHSQVSVQPANKPASAALSPGQLRSAYGLSKAAQASNKDTVAIVDAYNDWHAAGDLAKYRSYYGLGACKESTKCLRVVNQKGTTAWYPKGNAGWAEEESLDLDMVSAICPKCKILLVESNATTAGSLSAAEDTAVRLGAKFISNSWGGAEFSTEASYDSHFEHPGVAITVSAGDDGYSVRGPVARRFAGRHRGRRHHAVDEGEDPDPGEGLEPGCLATRPGRAAPVLRDPAGLAGRVQQRLRATGSTTTWRRTPTRGPGPPSTTPTPRQVGACPRAGSSWAGPARRARSSRPCTRWPTRAARPASGSLPTEFPYQAGSGLRDITIGSDGSCGGTYLCTAEAGYDGPTGLGVPSGVNAFK